MIPVSKLDYTPNSFKEILIVFWLNFLSALVERHNKVLAWLCKGRWQTRWPTSRLHLPTIRKLWLWKNKGIHMRIERKKKKENRRAFDNLYCLTYHQTSMYFNRGIRFLWKGMSHMLLDRSSAGKSDEGWTKNYDSTSQ